MSFVFALRFKSLILQMATIIKNVSLFISVTRLFAQMLSILLNYTNVIGNNAQIYYNVTIVKQQKVKTMDKNYAATGNDQFSYPLLTILISIILLVLCIFTEMKICMATSFISIYCFTIYHTHNIFLKWNTSLSFSLLSLSLSLIKRVLVRNRK